MIRICKRNKTREGSKILKCTHTYTQSLVKSIATLNTGLKKTLMVSLMYALNHSKMIQEMYAIFFKKMIHTLAMKLQHHVVYLVELALLWGNIRHVFHKWMCAGKIYTTHKEKCPNFQKSCEKSKQFTQESYGIYLLETFSSRQETHMFGFISEQFEMNRMGS